MGLLDDLKQIATAGGDVVRRPGEFLRELKFLAQGRPENYYDFLGDDVLEAQDGGFHDADKPLWLNLGYWKDAHTYPDACAAMDAKLHRATLDIVQGENHLFGWIADSADLIEALAPAPR